MSLHLDDSFGFCFCVVACFFLLCLIALCTVVRQFRREILILVCATLTFVGGVILPCTWILLCVDFGMDAFGVDLVITLALVTISWIQFLFIPWMYNKMHWCREARFKFIGSNDGFCAAGSEKCVNCPYYKRGDCS